MEHAPPLNYFYDPEIYFGMIKVLFSNPYPSFLTMLPHYL
jgi:hypothetical protein